MHSAERAPGDLDEGLLGQALLHQAPGLTAAHGQDHVAVRWTASHDGHTNPGRLLLVTLHRDNILVEVYGVQPVVEIKIRLPVLRAQRHMSQRQLASLAGLRPDTVSAMERGEAQGIRFDTLARLCEALGCGPGDLFELVDDGHRVPVFGGDDEDDILRERLKEAKAELIDGPSFLRALIDGRE